MKRPLMESLIAPRLTPTVRRGRESQINVDRYGFLIAVLEEQVFFFLNFVLVFSKIVCVCLFDLFVFFFFFTYICLIFFFPLPFLFLSLFLFITSWSLSLLIAFLGFSVCSYHFPVLLCFSLFLSFSFHGINSLSFSL